MKFSYKLFSIFSLAWLFCINAHASHDAPPSYAQALQAHPHQASAREIEHNSMLAQIIRPALPYPISSAHLSPSAPQPQSMESNSQAVSILQQQQAQQAGAAQLLSLILAASKQSQETTICDRADSCCIEYCVKQYKEHPCVCVCCGACLYAVCAPYVIVRCPFQAAYVCCGCNCAKQCLNNKNIDLR